MVAKFFENDRLNRFINHVIYRLPEPWLVFLARFSRRVRPPMHFLHVGKAGGTQLRARLLDMERDGARYHFVLQAHETTVGNLPRSHNYVINIRHPVSRFYSAFYFRKFPGPTSRPQSPDEKKVFEQFESANDLAESLEPGHHRYHFAEWGVKRIKHLNQPLFFWFTGSYERNSEIAALALRQLRQKPPAAVICQHHLETDLERFCAFVAPGHQLRISRDPRAALNTDYRHAPFLSKKAMKNLVNFFWEEILLWEELRSICPSEPDNPLAAFH